MNLQAEVTTMLSKHPAVRENPDRQSLIRATVENREVIVAANGAVATWTPPESTGRSPKDTVTVKRPVSEHNIDWDSPNNIPIDEETFDMLFADALQVLAGKKTLYVTDRVLGADVSYALPTRTISDYALSALFTDNMFRPVPDTIAQSIFANRGFTLLVLPYDKLDRERYKGRLRTLPGGLTSNMAVAMDMDRSLGIVYGSAYCGSIKKLMFTVMNYLLPAEGILPLHCSANEGPDGDIALLLGLSGTGKTTLSADPERALLGDDEHAWGDGGVANFENGCYAKLINLDPRKEPEIYQAIMFEAPFEEHGSIVENAMIYPDGVFDFDDDRMTPNSRGSYLLSCLKNIKPSSVGTHPSTILFLTADANGVLPPIAKLTPEQAMLWFLMGYTSKLAGTETGIVEPVTTFSRFFGEPFMPRNPDVYAGMLGERMKAHGTDVYLVNTGWSGGSYGIGSRMDIDVTRSLVRAALNGSLKNVAYTEDSLFHILLPQSCPGVPSKILNPRETWTDKKAYDARSAKLAAEFAAHFDKAYGSKNIAPEVAGQCPGK
ncbi:MAG: phosphoenolpyruvate carboxykinase (ATP) [Deltaproteobacteria bacterium]|nr:phosphoenolpyruvate carboxykinase (ATP) [Candidatus Anaeroferrophillus wilburensis]MBN2889953.1 phosphoenolpyruvate carboxykinase (ATP) [Deltaproteobacteria bacterium]